MIRSGQMHYLTGPEIITRRVRHLPVHALPSTRRSHLEAATSPPTS